MTRKSPSKNKEKEPKIFKTLQIHWQPDLDGEKIRQIEENVKNRHRFKNNPLYNKEELKTKHGEYLDDLSLYKLGQIDLEKLTRKKMRLDQYKVHRRFAIKNNQTQTMDNLKLLASYIFTPLPADYDL